MRTLSDYTKDAQTELFARTHSFFAFGSEQFNKAKEDGYKYVDVGGGLICPEETAKELLEGLAEITKKGIAQDLAENGKKRIINRELSNHEACYTQDITDTVEALEGYGISEVEIQAEFTEYVKRCVDF